MEPDSTLVEEKQGLSGTAKTLIGCGIGCGVLFFVAAALLGGAAWWFYSPGEQIDTQRIAGDETLLVLDVGDALDDEGVRALINRAFDAFQEVARSQREREMPESWQWVEDLNSAVQPSGSESIEVYVPRAGTLVLEPTDDPEVLAIVAALNFRNFVRPARFFIGKIAESEEAPVHEIEGIRVFELDEDDFYLGFVGGTAVLAQDLTALTRVLERLAAERPSPAVIEEVQRVRADWIAAGAGVGGDWNLVQLMGELLDESPEDLGSWTDEADWEFERATFGVAPVSADSVEATVTVRGAGEGVGDALVRAIDEVRDRLDVEKLVWKRTALQDGSRLELNVSVTGIEAALDAWVEENR